jgi:hypothetical protein
MPAQGFAPQLEFASWRVPQFARAIEYSLEVMEEIRAFACYGLLQRSHSGNEVGGVLFGTRRDDLIRILTWRPIACDHTQGEGLKFSYNDRMNLAVQLEMARQNPDLKDLRPVGWFVSRWGGGVSLSPSHLEIYNGFFPDAWQVALVISTQGGGRARAGFFIREAEDKLLAEASYRCFDLEPLHLSPMAAPQPTYTAPVQPMQPAPAPLPPVRASVPPPALEIPAPSFHAPSFHLEEKLPTHERWLWAVPVALAFAIAAFMLYQRSAPAPNTSLALRALSEFKTVQLTWDAGSRAVRDSDHAAMDITDGGKSMQISLSADQLHAGKMAYAPQSGDIGFALTVYPANGDPIHDSTRLIAPAFNAPTEAPQPLPAIPPPASAEVPPTADHDALEQQNHGLRVEIGKERARTEELQNLVRILENRLGIPPELPKTELPKTQPHP